MHSYFALTTITGTNQAENLGEALEELEPAPTGVVVFEVDDGSDVWEVGAYFLESPSAVDLALLTAGFGCAPFVITEIPDQDWVAKVQQDLPPVEAGRFFVYGSHDADRVPQGRIALLIEAAMAFGTGHHGTTLGCLRAFDRLLDQGRVFHNVLDLGCGTAVLAMAAAKVFPETVLASDIDPVAVDVAMDNVAANDLAGRVQGVVAMGFAADALTQAAPFDLIFANILKGPLTELAPEISTNLSSGGVAILSGLLVEQADAIIATYAAVGLILDHREDLGEWSALTLIKA